MCLELNTLVIIISSGNPEHGSWKFHDGSIRNQSTSLLDVGSNVHKCENSTSNPLFNVFSPELFLLTPTLLAPSCPILLLYVYTLKLEELYYRYVLAPWSNELFVVIMIFFF